MVPATRRAGCYSKFSVMNGKTINGLFVALGRWERKGLPVLLEAVRLANDGGGEPRVRLQVAGRPGRGEEHLLNELAVLEKEGAARYWGFLADVSPAYQEADLLLVASCYETFSLVMLDAIRYGLPMLTTRVNGVEELLANENGLVLAADPVVFAQALLSLYEDRPRLAAMAERSAALRERFAVADIAQQTLDVYCRTLNRSAEKEGICRG